MKKLEGKIQIKSAIGAIPVCGLLVICLEIGLAFLHRGGSLQKHMIHFAVLLLVAWGMMLLYGAVPNIRQIWTKIDQKVLNAERRKPWIDIIYAILAIIMLLHHFYVLLYYPKIPAGASRFAPLWIPFAIITVLMGKLWKNKGFWICTVFTVYMFERTYLKDVDISGETMVYIVSMIYAFDICYGMLYVIRPKYRHCVLGVLCAAWTLATLAFCATGLSYAWTGKIVKNLGEEITYYDNQGRLCFFSRATTSGGIIAGGAMFAFVGFAIARKKWCKVIYGLACLPMLVANKMTGTRSTLYILSFAIAGMITLGVWGFLKKKYNIQKQKNILLAFSLIVCFVGFFSLAMIGQNELKTQFITIRNRGGLIMSSAQAETNNTTDSSQQTKKSNRDIIMVDIDNIDEADNWLTGRITIWRDAYLYTQTHPQTLFCGVSADGSTKEVINRNDHCHNILIQIFIEGGLPGIGLFLGLMIYFFIYAYRLWRRWELPLWQRSLPIPVFALMIMEMVECLTHFAYGHVPMTVLYFFIGATVAMSKQVSDNRQQVTEGSSLCSE